MVKAFVGDRTTDRCDLREEQLKRDGVHPVGVEVDDGCELVASLPIADENALSRSLKTAPPP